MIWTTRTVTCDFCGEWRPIDDGETARDARKRLRVAGWRGLPHANQRGRLMDACPKHPAFPSGAVGGPDSAGQDGQP